MNLSQCKSKTKQRWSKIAFPGAWASFTARHFGLSSVATVVLCGCACGPMDGRTHRRQAETHHMHTHTHTHTHPHTQLSDSMVRGNMKLEKHKSIQAQNGTTKRTFVLPFFYYITQLTKRRSDYLYSIMDCFSGSNFDTNDFRRFFFGQSSTVPREVGTRRTSWGSEVHSCETTMFLC